MPVFEKRLYKASRFKVVSKEALHTMYAVRMDEQGMPARAINARRDGSWEGRLELREQFTQRLHKSPLWVLSWRNKKVPPPAGTALSTYRYTLRLPRRFAPRNDTPPVIADAMTSPSKRGGQGCGGFTKTLCIMHSAFCIMQSAFCIIKKRGSYPLFFIESICRQMEFFRFRSRSGKKLP